MTLGASTDLDDGGVDRRREEVERKQLLVQPPQLCAVPQAATGALAADPARQLDCACVLDRGEQLLDLLVGGGGGDAQRVVLRALVRERYLEPPQRRRIRAPALQPTGFGLRELHLARTVMSHL